MNQQFIYDEWGMPMPQEELKYKPIKRLVSISDELHHLIQSLAIRQHRSMEQVVSSAVIKQARNALNTYDADAVSDIYPLLSRAEAEIKKRYLGERSRRSEQMRRMNNERLRHARTC
jgi:hypothetical protein